LHVGEDWYIPLIFDPVFNVTGFSVSFYLYAQGILVFEKTLTAGAITFSNLLTGVGILTILRADTIKLSPKTYTFSIRRTDINSNKMLGYGTISLLP